MNILSKVVLAAGISLTISCGANSSNTNDAETAGDSLITSSKKDKPLKDTLPKEVNEVHLGTAKAIEVITAEKEMKGESAAEDYTRCKKWTLTTKQIESIIRKFKSMSGEEQNLAYSFYQCRISGEIKIDQVRYKYWLGAGGTLTLKNGDTSLYFGFPGKEWE